jgi:hypothetical protein
MATLIQACLIVSRLAIALILIGASVHARNGRGSWRWVQWMGIAVMNVCTILMIMAEFIPVRDDGTHRLPLSFSCEDLVDTVGITIFAIGYAGQHLFERRVATK